MAQTTRITLRVPQSVFPVLQPQIIPRLGLPCGFCRVPVREGDTHGVWEQATRAFVCTLDATVYDPAHREEMP